MKTDTMLYLGGGAVALLLLLKSKGSTPIYSNTGTGINTNSNPAINTGNGTYQFFNQTIPMPPTSFNDAYYKQYQYPAMLAANPNVGNPNYRMSDAECEQYASNYKEIREWAKYELGRNFDSLNQAYREHWKLYGVSMKYSFLPFTPPKDATWSGPPPNENTSNSGGSWVTDALGIATTVLAILGPTDQKLNDTEAAILICGSPIVFEMLPFFRNVPGDPASAINAKLTSLIEEYTA